MGSGAARVKGGTQVKISKLKIMAQGVNNSSALKTSLVSFKKEISEFTEISC